jgi:hypothetical protein
MRLVHRVSTSATPAQVWQLLGSPESWPLFELSLRGVRGRLASGEPLMALLRFSAIGVPVDVVEVVPEQRLAVVVRLLPGLREELLFELAPALRGGTDISLSVVVDGLLAAPAVVPLWMYDGLITRVLAARSHSAARQARRAAA